MAIKVYGHPYSTCTRKVLTTLHEKGQEFEFVMVDLMKGEHKQPAHLARQPFGVVPAIDHDGFALYESRAIIAYLDEALTGAGSLSPREPQARGLMNQWSQVEQSYFTPAAMKVISEEMFAPMFGRETNSARADEGKAEVAKVVEVIDRTLANRSFFAGEQFTLADINYMPYVAFLMGTSGKSIITGSKGMSAWWERVSNRPSWKKVAG